MLCASIIYTVFIYARIFVYILYIVYNRWLNIKLSSLELQFNQFEYTLIPLLLLLLLVSIDKEIDRKNYRHNYRRINSG
jgi:hypothetical protein